MKLLKPWGLLLLLSIPILVLIYILKREHRQMPVGSAYLWRISDRFLKKRKPLRLFTVLLSFLLQMSLLALTAFGAALPATPLGSVAPQIVIIDASGSMQTADKSGTRFERAVKAAEKLADSPLCTSMTVIIASDAPYCLVSDGTPAEAKDALRQAECTWGGCGIYEAFCLARDTYDGIGRPHVTFYSDSDYALIENVDVVDMRDGEINIAVTNGSHIAGRFSADVTCFGEDRTVAVGLYVDGELIGTATADCTDGSPARVSFDTEVYSYTMAEIVTDEKDALPEDDRYILLGRTADPARVLVIGTDTLFLKSGLEAVGRCEVKVKDRYARSDDGRYDLYVFADMEKVNTELPVKGTVIGFTTQKEAGRYGVSLIGAFISPRDMNTNLIDSGTAMGIHDPLLDGVGKLIEDVSVGQGIQMQMPIGSFNRGGVVVGSEEPPTVLLSFSTWDPALVVRDGSRGYKQYVFCFDLGNSNFALTPAFMMMLENAVDIAVPPPIRETTFEVGGEVRFTLPVGAAAPRVLTPDGRETALNTVAPVCVPDTPGVWTLCYERAADTRLAAFAVTIPASEYLTVSEEAVYMPEIVRPGGSDETSSRSLDQPVAAVLLLLLLAEWGYCIYARH